MTSRAALACCLLALACTGAFAASPPPAGGEGAPRILVMVRMPPPHFRPGEDYGTAYGSDAGRAAPRRIARAVADDYRLDLLTDWPMPALGVDCFVMRMHGDAPVAGVLDRLRGDARIESAQYVQTFNALGARDPLYALQPEAARWYLDALHRLADGRGVKIALIDTGVQTDHPDLRGQFDLAKNFVDDAPVPAEIHGTAVAGLIAAAQDNGIGIAGVAPGARLLALRACWQRARDAAAACDSFTLAKSLQFAIAQRVAIINLSLSGPRDELLGRLLDVALARGIAVVGAVDPAVKGGGYPAAHAGVFAVGADTWKPALPGEIAAPAQDLPTTLPVDRWGFVSGSSFAAAELSGLLALLYQARPDMSLADARRALAAGGASRLDACAALAHAGGRCSCECGIAREAHAQSLH